MDHFLGLCTTYVYCMYVLLFQSTEVHLDSLQLQPVNHPPDVYPSDWDKSCIQARQVNYTAYRPSIYM
jgi:hypothetical protein